MKIMYIDCGMGAAGDMLTAALLELIPDREDLVRKLNGIWRDGVETVAKSEKRCGIRGTLVDVLVDGRAEGEAHDHDHVHATHDHHYISDVMSTIQGMDIPENVKRDAGEIYRIIADAESRVHGEPVGEIHFHEVGMYDAIADVVSVCLLMDRIKPDRVVASPVNTGSGTVHCAHGVMPVPAPAAALILAGIPAYNDEIKGELCTPTGAALLKYYVNIFGNMPLMRTERTGYGLGHKDFPRANCVRVMLGETEEADKTDRVTGLSCNVDDMTGEELGYAIDRLMEKGAKEAYVVPVVMKKSRPGYELNVLCDTSDREMMVREIFRLTSTIGIRETLYSRYVMDRTTGEMYTSYGRVRVKESSGYGVTRRKFEYDDLKAIADKEGIGIGQARQMIDRG